MAKSDLLRVQDVRDAYRLIGDCRDVGSDPALWFPRMLEGLCQLLGAKTATGGEGRWLRPHRPIEPLSAFQVGLSGRDYELFVAYMRSNGVIADPVYRPLQRLPGRLITRTRRDVVSDAVWYRSAVYNDNFRPAGIDHRIVSLCQVSDAGAIVGIDLDRARGDPDFSPRQQRLLQFFHDELARLVGRSLVSATEPEPAKLPPRLRQTPRVSARRRQREASCGAAGSESGDDPPVRHGAVPPFRRPEPRATARVRHAPRRPRAMEHVPADRQPAARFLCLEELAAARSRSTWHCTDVTV
jgi:hypothetical protein